MKNWLKTNWLGVLIVILLLMIYARLGEVSDNAFYTADMVDASTSRIINIVDGRLQKIQFGIEDINAGR